MISNKKLKLAFTIVLLYTISSVLSIALENQLQKEILSSKGSLLHQNENSQYVHVDSQSDSFFCISFEDKNTVQVKLDPYQKEILVIQLVSEYPRDYQNVRFISEDIPFINNIKLTSNESILEIDLDNALRNTNEPIISFSNDIDTKLLMKYSYLLKKELPKPLSLVPKYISLQAKEENKFTFTWDGLSEE